MTIQEAIKSGKQFRQPGGPWLSVFKFKSGDVWFVNEFGIARSGLLFQPKQILADNWEVKEE